MNSTFKSGTIAVLAAAALTASMTGAAGATSKAHLSTAATTVARTEPPAFAPADPKSRDRAKVNADAALAAGAERLHKGSGDAFTLSSNVAGTYGLQYLTYERTYKGLPVYGGEVVVGTDRAGQVIQQVVTGQTAKIKVGTEPSVTGRQAAATARALLPQVDEVTTAKLVVHATSATPKLAWRVQVAGRTATGRPSVLDVFVDARSGSLIDKFDKVHEGTGRGFYNGTVTIDTSGSAGSYRMVDTTRPGLQCGGQNGSAYTKSSDSWGNGSGTDLETACVDALYAAQMEWNMLRDWLGRNGHSGTGRSFPIRVGLNDVNAFWNGSYTTFGHNQAGNQQATPMDVVGHEFGHSVFTNTPGGDNGNNEVGGLNESTGDIFGALTEAYANNPNDPPDYQVGEEVNLVGNGPIRYMYNPSQVGDPNCYSTAIPTTEVHAAAGPQNHWFYLLAEGNNPGGGKPSSPICQGGPSSVTGVGIQKAGKIFMGTLQAKTQPWTHAKARVASLNAAKALFPNSCVEFNTVKSAWDAVSVRGTSDPTCVANPDTFSLQVSPGSGAADPGGSAATTLSTVTTGGNAQQIQLRTGTLPAGVTAQFNPATIQSGQSSTLTLNVAANAAPGTYTVQVIAQGTAQTQTQNYSLTVNRPIPDQFSLTLSPTSGSVDAGGSTASTLTTTTTSGNAQQIQLRTGTLPAGVTAQFNPATIQSGQSSALTLATASSVPAGTYTVQVIAQGTAQTQTQNYTLTVSRPGDPDSFSVRLDPEAGTATAGGTVATTVNTATTGGQPQQVTLSAAKLPNGVTVAFDPATIQSGQSSRLTFTVASTAKNGTYPITVTATGTAQTQTVSYALTVTGGTPAGDFTVAADPSSATVTAGATGTTTLKTQVTTGRPIPLTLAADGVPPGATVTFSPSSINSGESSTVTVTTSSSTPAQTYTITLNANGAASHGTSFSLTVNGGGGGDTWQEWHAYNAGDEVTYQGVRYRCVIAHTSQPDWTPDVVPALWQRIG
ncbi:M4 family metallopeptidase [Nonomuraea sp. NPDC005730]|uniref:M4 family metallopeptidase n=3 Tax=unclassified Nonomuraea TaxID=2593643 RepID=UPI0033CD860E